MLKVGDVKMIYNKNFGGEVIEEGLATLIARIDPGYFINPERWAVRFHSDIKKDGPNAETYERFVRE